MTDQDKAEIRQIIREELNARGVAHVASPCNHQWYTNYTLTVPTTVCRICGAYQTTDNNVAVISFPDPIPQPFTVKIDPKDSIQTVSPEY